MHSIIFVTERWPFLRHPRKAPTLTLDKLADRITPGKDGDSHHARPHFAAIAREVTAAADNAGSQARMLHILELFSEETQCGRQLSSLRPCRTPGRHDTATSKPCMTRDCSPRYAMATTSRAAIIELDLHIRRADSLLLASHGVLEDLVYKIGHSALLPTVFGDDSVLCGGEHRAVPSPENRFGRGQRRPFQGAGAKVILARFPSSPESHLAPVIAQRFRQPGSVARVGSSASP